MKIGMISSDWSLSYRDSMGHPVPGGAGWYRIVMPARELERNGHQVVVGESFEVAHDIIAPRDFFGGFHDDCDLIVFQRWTHQNAHIIIRRAKSAGQVIVNDIDDWFFGLTPSNAAFKAMHPKENPISNVVHYRSALAASSALTASTQYLADRLSRLGPPVHVIRNAVDLAAFSPLPFTAEKPVIGWTGSTAHRSGDLETMRGLLWPFMERHGLNAFHGGAHERLPSFAEGVGIPVEHTDRVSEVEMLPIIRYPEFFSHFDLGIVPLADVPFNKAKSAIKGMEYAAARIPFVAQATDEYRWLGAGLVCERPKHWRSALERLVDPGERSLIGAQGYERVKSEDIALRWVDWADTYRALVT